MIDVQVFGLQPFGHHLVSVLIHAANALLVLLLWAAMTGRVWRSAAVAALFAVHPLRVESIAWVAERKDVREGPVPVSVGRVLRGHALGAVGRKCRGGLRSSRHGPGKQCSVRLYRVSEAELRAVLAFGALSPSGEREREGRSRDGASHLAEAVAARPESEHLRFEHARCLLAAGERIPAKEELRAALRLAPRWRPAVTLLAALLATSPDTTSSEGAEALDLAGKLVEQSGGRDPNDLDALAAAQAQTGRYPDAVETARRAIRLAEESGQTGLARVIATRLAFYQARRPYRTASK